MESIKNHSTRVQSGFYEKYCRGAGLDIGAGAANSVLRGATVVEVGVTPDYDGVRLPYGDASQDFVFSSHCLEHIEDPYSALREWYRVLKPNGYMILIVPHRDLYEKKYGLPSRWNLDHKRYYTPSSLLREVEVALRENSWRCRSLRDNDDNFDYGVPPDKHAVGSYEIECVIQKITPPAWELL